LTETLELVKEKSPELVKDLEVDPSNCTWEDVLIELHRAKDAAINNEKRSKRWYRRPLGWLGNNAPIISQGLSAFPDWLAPLHGGLAVVLSVSTSKDVLKRIPELTLCEIARHHEQVRNKIIRAFENLADVAHMAQSKARCFPTAEANLESIRLHECIDHLQRTLLRTLPELIKRLDAGKLCELSSTSSYYLLVTSLTNSQKGNEQQTPSNLSKLTIYSTKSPAAQRKSASVPKA